MKRWGSTGDDDGAKAAKKNYTLFHTGINSIKGDTQSSVKLKVARWLKNKFRLPPGFRGPRGGEVCA